MWNGIELRELETVLVLAEELHFGRTAERLGVSTSHVSQTVGSVERRLKGRLFERTSRRVSLTLLGEFVVREVGPVVGELNARLAECSGLAEGLTGTLRVGHIATAEGTEAVARLIAEFQRRVSTVTVRRLRMDLLDYVTSLRREEVDIWLSWWPEPAPSTDDGAGLRCGPPIARQPAAFLMGRAHPLAGRPSISLEDLVEHPVAEPPARGPELFRRSWIPATSPSGRPIARVVEPSWQGHFHELVPVLERGELGWLTIASLLDTLAMPPTLVTVPVRDAPDFVLVPWWQAERETPAITAFARMGGELAG